MAQTETFGTGGSKPKGEVQRLFFALWPDAAARVRLARAVAGLRAQHAKAGRWTAVERYHLTLQFLGDYAPAPPALIDAACAAAETVRMAPFALTLDCVGSFRNRSIPWWLGCTRTPDGLRALRDQLGAALQEAQVRYDMRREFSPHVTVLRDARSPLPENAVPPVDWSVNEFVLLESRLGTANAGYAVLRRFPLHR
jgi:2'-5' RNA ligase